MGVVEIPLLGRYGEGKIARVDECFAKDVRAHKWYLSNGHMYAKISGVTVYLHRYIFALANMPVPNRIEHVNRNRLDCCLENLRPARSARGCSLILNPHSFSGGRQSLSSAELDTSERQLRNYLTERRTQLQLEDDEPLWLATERIVKLTMEALTKTHAAWWSSFGEWDVYTTSHMDGPLHVGPQPPRRPEPRDLWHDTNCIPHVVKEYNPSGTWRTVLDDLSPGMPEQSVRAVLAAVRSSVEVRVRWPRLTALNADIYTMLTNRIGRAGHKGRAAYLACATLSALLNVETQHVVDLLAKYRRMRKHA